MLFLAIVTACISIPDYRPFTVYNDSNRTIVRVIQLTTKDPKQVRYLKLWKPIRAGANDDVSAELVGKAPDTRIFEFVFSNSATAISAPIDPGQIRGMRVSDRRVTIIKPTPKPGKAP